MTNHPSAVPGCVFCDRSKIASDIVDVRVAGADFMLFEPLDPVTRGHKLIVPVQHLENAWADPRSTGLAAEVAATVAAAWSYDANLITSIGLAATQTIQHLHWHLVPRREGDGLALPWSPR